MSRTTTDGSAAARSRRVSGVLLWAAGVGVLGFLAIVIVSVQGIAGATPSVVLTWFGMIVIPLAFLVMAIELVRSFLARRSAA
ncbi:hypothetical protein [Brevibacterium litoralis]|uniref:hypothetical protein n=1 Tax=Brevibacterium litoralis TaxID=3138935 RepID=UPI0032EFC61F